MSKSSKLDKIYSQFITILTVKAHTAFYFEINLMRSDQKLIFYRLFGWNLKFIVSV